MLTLILDKHMLAELEQINMKLLAELQGISQNKHLIDLVDMRLEMQRF